MLSLLLSMSMLINEPQVEQIESAFKNYTCLVEAIHFEANGEGYKGKQIVANVINNRMDRVNKWEDQCAVIYAKGQFTYDKSASIYIDNPIDAESFKETLVVSALAVTDQLEDITNGADHYYNPDKVPKKKPWMDEKYEVGQHKNHVYLRLISDEGKWF